MRFRFRVMVLLLPLAGAFAACDDPNTFRLDPVIVTDTVELAAPTASGSALPTAVDIFTLPRSGAPIGGGRFPERVDEADAWDLALRARGDSLVLVPRGAVGFESFAAITRPITDRDFDAVEEAPGSSSFVSDSAVVLQEGAVYVARSRRVQNTCSEYAKIQPLEVNVEAQTARLQVATSSAFCGDPRLVEED